MATENPAHIVLIEDNPLDVQVLRHAFDVTHKSYGLEVLVNGEEVYRFLEDSVVRDKPKPCLIILDLHLPKIDGITILKELQSNPVMADVPVVVLSTIASPQERRKVQELGAYMYQNKPMEWKEMLSLANDLLEICKDHNHTLPQPAVA